MWDCCEHFTVSKRVRHVLNLSDYQPPELSVDQKYMIGSGGSRSAGDARGDTPELEWDFVTFLLVRHMASYSLIYSNGASCECGGNGFGGREQGPRQQLGFSPNPREGGGKSPESANPRTLAFAWTPGQCHHNACTEHSTVHMPKGTKYTSRGRSLGNLAQRCANGRTSCLPGALALGTAPAPTLVIASISVPGDRAL